MNRESINKFVIVLICLFIPLSATANLHLISINPIKQFPDKVEKSTTVNAIYSVTNIAWMPLKVIDKSCFPPTSGLSMPSFNCDHSINPGESCTIELQLKAPATPQVISTRLIETVSPSPTITDKVSYPILISIINRSPDEFTITPEAGEGGGILPSTPQIVSRGQKQSFLAVPNYGYKVDKWYVDNSMVQKNEQRYTLENVTADHTVKVTFAKCVKENHTIVTVGATDKNGVTNSKPILMTSYDNGYTWQENPLLADKLGVLWTVSCTKGNDAVCVAVGRVENSSSDDSLYPLLIISKDGGRHWETNILDFKGTFIDVSCTGQGKKAICVAAGYDYGRSSDTIFFYVSHDAGENWQKKIEEWPYTRSVHLYDISCSGKTCMASGGFTDREDNYRDYATYWRTTDGGLTWGGGGNARGSYDVSSCTGMDAESVCVIGGTGHEWVDDQNRYKLLTVFNSKGAHNVSGQGTYITRITCTGSGAKAICFATIENDDLKTYWISLSRDGGETWGTLDIKNKYGVTCTPYNNNSFCIAWGTNEVDISKENAQNWITRKISNINPAGFSDGSCFNENSGVVCTLVGYQKDGSPQIVVSSNSGEDWDLKRIDSPSKAYLFSVSST